MGFIVEQYDVDKVWRQLGPVHPSKDEALAAGLFASMRRYARKWRIAPAPIKETR